MNKPGKTRRASRTKQRTAHDTAIGAVLASYADARFFSRHKRRIMVYLALFCFVYGMFFAVFARAFMVPLLAPVAILLLVAIWLLPESDNVPTGLLEKLLLSFIVALLCWPDYLALTLPGLPWITAIRLVGMPLAVTLLICASMSRAFRAQLADTLSATPIIGKFLLAFVAIALLSVAFSREPGESFSKFIVAQVYWTSIFLCAAFTFRKPGRIVTFSYILWGAAIFVCLIAVWEWRLQRLPWLGHIPSFLAVQDPSVQNILSAKARAAAGIYRTQSKFTTPLGLAEFMALSAPFMLFLSTTHKRLFVRLAALATLPLMFFVIILADSRLGVVGFFMAILIYILVVGILRWRADKESLLAPAIVISYPVLFSAFIAATFLIGRLRVMVWGGGAQQFSTDSRKEQYLKGIPMILERPWGHGMGQGGQTLHYTNRAGDVSIDAYYLSIALEFGIIGFFVYFGMFLAGIYYGATALLKPRSPEVRYLVPLIIALINFFIIKSIFSQQENHPLVFAMLGAVVALVWRAQREGKEALPQ